VTSGVLLGTIVGGAIAAGLFIAGESAWYWLKSRTG
jgi:hypothetical protein